MSEFNKEQITSCKEYAKTKKEEIKNTIKHLARQPRLVVIQIDDDPASNSYIKKKKEDCAEVGIDCIHTHINSQTFSQEELEKLITEYSYSEFVDGIILQLPIPQKYDLAKLKRCIQLNKDVDGMNYESPYLPCTPKGIVDWLDYNKYDLTGKNIVVIGRSNIVGRPLVNLLINKDATVTCCHSKTQFLFSHTSRADVIISAIGQPKYFNNAYFNNPDLIIDVGINRYGNNKLCGDIDKEDVEDYCKDTYVTPVPNGVGLLTRIALLENIVRSVRRSIYAHR